jgi:hypothetical protein
MIRIFDMTNQDTLTNSKVLPLCFSHRDGFAKPTGNKIEQEKKALATLFINAAKALV